MKSCCKLGSLKGMQWGHDILDRLLVEKHRLLHDQVLVSVPVKLWGVLLFGWAHRSKKDRVGQRRMKEVVDMAVQEAVEDARVFQKYLAAPDGDIKELGPGQDAAKPLSQPSTAFFNTYLYGLTLAANLTPSSALECEVVIANMYRLSTKQGWFTKPNTRSYTHCITAFGNSQRVDAGDRALRILRRMQQIHSTDKELYREKFGIAYDETNPDSNKKKLVTADLLAYTATMSAMVKSASPTEKIATDVKSLLNEVLESDHLALDPSVLAVALSCYPRIVDKDKNAARRVSAAKEAEDLLWTMIRGNIGNEKESLLVCFNTCLDIWSKSFSRESAPRCEELLEKMFASKLVEPSKISFNSCLYGMYSVKFANILYIR